MPQWGGKKLDEQLLEPVIASLRQSKARRDSDCKAMDGVQPPTRVDPAALAERLGQSRLGKAARAVQPTEVGFSACSITEAIQSSRHSTASLCKSKTVNLLYLEAAR